MDTSDDELKKIMAKKIKDDRYVKNLDKRRQIIKDLVNTSQLNNITPIWHTTARRIDFNKQKHQLPDKYLEDGFTILKNVDIEILINSTTPGNIEMYGERLLYHPDLQDWKIDDILHYWYNNTKLIPPTITLLDETLEYYDVDRNELYISDGTHRINVANFYGAKTIPIIVSNKQLERIKDFLNIF